MKILLLNLMLLILTSCGGGSTTGNPVTTVRMEDKQAFAIWNKLHIIPEAKAATSNIKFCFKRLRFKPDSTTTGSQIDLVLGQVDIDPNGVNIVNVQIPAGTYRRIEFDLEGECDGTTDKPSVIFSNDNGTFSTTENMTIKFDGSYTISSTGTVTLDIDAINDAMDLINSNNQIKSSLENAIGNF